MTTNCGNILNLEEAWAIVNNDPRTIKLEEGWALIYKAILQLRSRLEEGDLKCSVTLEEYWDSVYYRLQSVRSEKTVLCGATL
jgi:hypothetical protein